MTLATKTQPAVIDNSGENAYTWHLVEELTSRELDVLSYLPTQLTSAEIAAQMHLSVNTVRFHPKNVYRELEAETRDLAVVRADEPGLKGGTPRRRTCGSGWIVDPGPATRLDEEATGSLAPVFHTTHEPLTTPVVVPIRETHPPHRPSRTGASG